jgi:hypothetical protein
MGVATRVERHRLGAVAPMTIVAKATESKAM